MNCKEWYDKLYQILDRDMEESVWKDVEVHMKECRSCWDRYEFEKRLKEKVKSSCCIESCTESLRKRVKALFKNIKIALCCLFINSQSFLFRHVISEPLRYPLARGMARLTCLFNRRRRQLIVSNLTPIVGPQKAALLAPTLLGNFSMTAVDFFCSRRNLARSIKEENAAIVEKAYRRYKKVIVVTAHIGNWELGMSYLIEKGFSMAGVYAPYREDDVVDWIMSHRNPDVEWIPAAKGAAKACINALERGRLLGMVADIPFGEKGHRVPMCGSWTRLPLGPWAIASRARATVIPGFVIREKPGHYRIIFHEPILPREGTFRRQMLEMQDVYRGHLEHYLKTIPEQWGVLQPFWEPK